MSKHSGVVGAVERVVDRGGEADDILRQVVTILHERLDRFVRISFVEADGLMPGPALGEEALGERALGDESRTTAFPISFQRKRVADLEVGGDLTDEDRALLERVAILISPYALVGWDTKGEEWTP